MECPRCKTRRLVVIDLEVSGERVSLHSCSACDVRWWQDAGGPLALDGILSLVSSR